MTIKELYAQEPERWIEDVSYSRFFEEAIQEDLHGIDYCADLQDPESRIKLAIHKDHDFDGRRCWSLWVCHYQDEPILIIQRAGREGDDHVDRFITNERRYKEMIQYIMFHVAKKQIDDVFSVDDDVVIDNFYGYSLSDFEGKE